MFTYKRRNILNVDNLQIVCLGGRGPFFSYNAIGETSRHNNNFQRNFVYFFRVEKTKKRPGMAHLGNLSVRCRPLVIR